VQILSLPRCAWLQLRNDAAARESQLPLLVLLTVRSLAQHVVFSVQALDLLSCLDLVLCQSLSSRAARVPIVCPVCLAYPVVGVLVH
jgi:hypothetical protein